MEDGTGVGQSLHQLPGAAGMIEMYVRQKNVIDVTAVDAFLAQRFQEQGDARVDAGIDEGCASVVDDQVTGIEQWPHVVGVDGGDAVVQVSCAYGIVGRHRYKT
jgi:hypothetical protein